MGVVGRLFDAVRVGHRETVSAVTTMGGRREDWGPVSREVFVFLVDWLEKNFGNPKFPKLSDASLAKLTTPVREWLEQLRDSDWPDSPREYKAYEVQPNQQKYYKKVSTQVRKALGVACRVNRFRRCALTMKHKTSFRLAWGDYDRPGVKRVFWLRLPYPSLFSDMLLLGARSVAHAFGLDMEVRDILAGNGLDRQVRELVERLETSEHVRAVRKRTAFVIELASIADVGLSDCLDHYHTVTSGTLGSTIAQKNVAIGIQLAQEVLLHFAEFPLRIAVLSAKGGLTTWTAPLWCCCLP